jgi:HlyD family secretion protein
MTMAPSVIEVDAPLPARSVWQRRAVVIGLFLGSIMLARAWGVRHRAPVPAKYVEAKVGMGDVVEDVLAKGSVQPRASVDVGAQENGRVARVLVDFGSRVKKGDVLAELETGVYDSQVGAQRAGLRQRRADLDSSRAQVESAWANLETARLARDRTRRLVASHVASQADLDSAAGNFDSAKASYDAAVARVRGADAAARAQSAQVEQSAVNLAYTKIYSPLDGVIVSRNVDPGATVNASYQSPVLFTVASDLGRVRIFADVDESDVGRVRVGQAVDAVADGAMGAHFRGEIEQVRYSPNNTSGIVTYTAVIEVDNPGELLRPGMSVTLDIVTAEAHRVRCVPAAALRFHPKRREAPEEDRGAIDLLPPVGMARVYVVTNSQPGQEQIEEKLIHVGLHDSSCTELRGESLALGASVIVDEAAPPSRKFGP